jgi:hypothetical protein
MNMAFAITLTMDGKDTEKHTITELITSNGGKLLEDGFDELFDNVNTADASMSSTKSIQKSKGKAMGSVSEGLSLKPEFEELRFAARITDAHSRRTKYVQALALNIPCLHHRWLSDSIAASRPLPFGKYLLPAGISTYLDPNGAIRSRTMELYDPNADAASFQTVMKKRELLLSGQSVLLVMGKSKEEIERKKPYLFLTHALGPNAVGRCPDIDAAKEEIKSGQWDWVYVDGGVNGVAEAESILFSNAPSTSFKSTAKSKKRKRESDVGRGPLVRVGEVGGHKVRLACDEFVIQSLILGSLFEG